MDDAYRNQVGLAGVHRSASTEDTRFRDIISTLARELVESRIRQERERSAGALEKERIQRLSQELDIMRDLLASAHWDLERLARQVVIADRRIEALEEALAKTTSKSVERWVQEHSWMDRLMIALPWRGGLLERAMRERW